MLLFIDDDFYAFLLISRRSLSKAKDGGKMTESLMEGILLACYLQHDRQNIYQRRH